MGGIGVCIGVPAKRGQTQDAKGRARQKKGKKRAVNCYLHHSRAASQVPGKGGQVHWGGDEWETWVSGVLGR